MAESESTSALTEGKLADYRNAIADEGTKPIVPSSLREGDTEKETQSNLPGSNPPDGGVVAWLVILGVWCCSFGSFGWINSRTCSCGDKIYADYH
jgi:hypothetical protein